MQWYDIIGRELVAHGQAEWQTASDAVDMLPPTHRKAVLKLAWLPSWYASDQSLYRDVWADYKVFLRVSTSLAHALQKEQIDNIFYGGGMGGYWKHFKGESLLLPVDLRLRITRIDHPKIDGIKAIVWERSQFLVTCDDGSCVFLDDEERAGLCDIEGVQPEDWNLVVTADTDLKQMQRLHDHYAQHPLP